MKLLLVSFGLISVIMLMSFTKYNINKSNVFNSKNIEKSVVKINDKLYACKYEVTNNLYRDFLNNLKSKDKPDLLKIAQVDTLNWLDKSMRSEPFANLYNWHPAYANYPVVNITYEAANLFCEWLTNEYNSNPNRKYKKVIFRLPTEKEWEKAAQGSQTQFDYPWGNKLLIKDFYMCNFKSVGDENIRFDTITKKIEVDYHNSINIFSSHKGSTDITAPVESYNPNDFGLYNVCGNVAEMTTEKGLSKGGSWRSFGGDVKIKLRGHYLKSQNDLGFRYFMEIIEQ